MQKWHVILAIAAFAIGAFIAVYVYPIRFEDITSVIAQISQKIQSGLGQVAAWWNGIPELGRTLILAGIPTLFTLFFAWTKSRAIEKMQQVQFQAQQKIGGLREQLASYDGISEENRLLKTKLEAVQNSDLLGEATNQVALLRTTNLQLEDQIRTMTTRHLAEIGALNNTIEQLKIAEKTVVH